MSSGTPSSTSNGAHQDSYVTLSSTAAASSTTTSSNGARQSSATFSSTAAAASSSSGTSASGGAAVSSVTTSSGGTGISCRLQSLGGFAWDTPERTGIRDSARATPIIGILQLTASHRRVTWSQSEQMVALLGLLKTHLFCFSMIDPDDLSLS
jgi:hypothetical protein